MATLICKATGNFTAAGTWGPVSTVSGAELDSEVGTTIVPTSGSGISSATFTLAAAAVDGVAIKVVQRPGSTGTVVVTLANNTSPGVREGTTTANVSDIDSNGNGWYFFKFGAITPNGTDVYKVNVATPSGTNVLTLYRDGTASNWSRMIRLTSAASAPAAGDKLMVMGEWTAATILASFTVTMDETATTSYGPTVSGGPPQGMTVNKGGTLTFSTSIAAYLKWKGILAVYGGGTLSVGTIGARIGASSSAILEMDSVANVDSGLNVFPGGIFNAYGDNARLTNSLMTADKAAAATVITLAATTGWAASDVLAFASTTRTAADCESKIILTVDSAVQATLTAGLTNAHSGTSPTQAEVVNLTRNVKIRGVSATLQGYVVFQTTATVNVDYVEFTQLGSATTNKRGVDITTTTGACSITHCSLHDSTVASSSGINVQGAATSNITFSSNVTYNIANQHVFVLATSGTWTADSNVFIRNTDAGQNLVTLSDVGGTFTNNTMVGATSNGVSIAESAVIGTFTGNTCHSNGTVGIILTGGSPTSGTLDSITLWRNSSQGIDISAAGTTGLVFSNVTAFGNVLNIQLRSNANILFTNCTLSGDTTFTSGSGINVVANTSPLDIVVESSNFGVVGGIKTAHTTADVVCAVAYETITLRNCLLSSTTEVSSQSSLLAGSYVRSQKHDQTTGNHKTWTRYGTITIDTVVFDAASPSVRLAPNNATNKLAIDGGSVDGKGAFRVPVASGGSLTVTARVRKSVVGDGTAYNGNQPRLVLRKNVAAGIAADVVLATGVGAAGAWETLTGTATAAVTDDAVLSFVVDCDGTTGWLNVSGFSVTGKDNSPGNKEWLDGTPFCGLIGGSGYPRSRVIGGA